MNAPYVFLSIGEGPHKYELMILRTWHTKQSNIDRTNAVIKTLASMYKDMADVVSVIAPLNE